MASTTAAAALAASNACSDSDVNVYRLALRSSPDGEAHDWTLMLRTSYSATIFIVTLSDGINAYRSHLVDLVDVAAENVKTDRKFAESIPKIFLDTKNELVQLEQHPSSATLHLFKSMSVDDMVFKTLQASFQLQLVPNPIVVLQDIAHACAVFNTSLQKQNNQMKKKISTLKLELDDYREQSHEYLVKQQQVQAGLVEVVSGILHEHTLHSKQQLHASTDETSETTEGIQTHARGKDDGETHNDDDDDVERQSGGIDSKRSDSVQMESAVKPVKRPRRRPVSQSATKPSTNDDDDDDDDDETSSTK